jgi:hypothetical protein
MPKRRLRCALEDVADWHPNMFLDAHLAACAAVLRRYSESPATLEVKCENLQSLWLGRASRFLLEVSWGEEWADKAGRLRVTMQSRPLVEIASVALALALVHRVVPLGQLEVTRYGDGADYWAPSARRVLEVSGTENVAESARRHREKVTQALSNRFRWGAYVVVCAFSAQGHRIRFSGHR